MYISFLWASCSLCELHLREKILHRIVEFRSPLRGALCQRAVQPHFVLAVRRGSAAEFRRACFGCPRSAYVEIGIVSTEPNL